MADKDDYMPQVPGVGKVGSIAKAFGVVLGLFFLIGGGFVARMLWNRVTNKVDQMQQSNNAAAGGFQIMGSPA